MIDQEPKFIHVMAVLKSVEPTLNKEGPQWSPYWIRNCPWMLDIYLLCVNIRDLSLAPQL